VAVTWLLLTVAAVCSRGIYGVLSKSVGGHLGISGPVTAMVIATGCGLLAIPLSPFVGGLSTAGLAEHWPTLLVVCIASGFGGMAYFHGIRSLDAGTAQIVFSSIILWGLMLSALILDSRFAAQQLVGAAILIVAIAIAQFDERLRISSGAWFILLSAAMFSIFQVGGAHVADDVSAGTFLLLTNLGPAVLIAVAYGGRTVDELRQLRSIPARAAYVSMCTVAFSMSYFTCAYFAYRSAPDAGVVVILLTAQVVVAVLLSAIFLGERRHLGRKLAAGALAVLAGALIR
jgi:drug/metabolite transporter (DMT)-like permease